MTSVDFDKSGEMTQLPNSDKLILSDNLPKSPSEQKINAISTEVLLVPFTFQEPTSPMKVALWIVRFPGTQASLNEALRWAREQREKAGEIF